MQSKKIYVAGHRGMVGSAIVRQLLAAGQQADLIITRTHTELDLTNQAAVSAFFDAEKPNQVYLAAAKVGGIHANNVYPAEFIYDNLLKIEPALWHFLRNPAVPPTNNAAERALRGFVIKRKLSFFTRSGRGLRFLERIFSTVQTCAIQGRETFGYLQEVMSSWLAGKTAPSLVPDHVLARQACA